MDKEKLLAHLNKCWPAETSVATTEQLADAGCGDRQLTRAVALTLVIRLRRGAYIRASAWNLLKPWEQSKMRLWAHIVSTPGNHIYSHFSAARLLGLSVWNCDARVHLICNAPASGEGTAPDVCFHRLPLEPAAINSRAFKDGRSVFVTSMERTVVDCARFGGFVEAVIIGDSALYKGANLELMNSMVASLAGKPGARKARRVLAALNGLAESPGETRTRLFLAAMGLPEPVLQLWITANFTHYRADFAWPAIKLILEFDGNYKYYDFRPTAAVLRDERRRENMLIEQGWRVIRIECHHLANPHDLLRRINAAMAAASRVAGLSAAA